MKARRVRKHGTEIDNRKRDDLFATYAAARLAAIGQGATYATEPQGGSACLQTFFRPAPAFDGQWGAAVLMKRSDGQWELGPWILEGYLDNKHHGGALPFVGGYENWGQ